MSFFKAASIVTAAVASVVVIGTVAWFTYKSSEFDANCRAAMEVAEGTHKALMQFDAYVLASLGNRILWMQMILNEPLERVCGELGEEKLLKIKEYIFNNLETICAI